MIISGIFGGFFEIPIDSYIQVASPKEHRGKIVASSTFLSFFGVLAASCLLYLITEVGGFEADKGFTVVGGITLATTIIFTFIYFDYLTRFIAMILSRLHFKISFSGQENIPDIPAIYVCTHTAWNDTLLMLGSQRRRMRFFIEHEHDHNRWLKRLYSFLRIVQIPSPEPLENSKMCLSAIKYSLKQGISVCIFVENPNIQQEIEKLNHSYSFREILKEFNYPMIAVEIDKGTKEKTPRFFKRLLEKFRVPASISFGYL